MADIKQAAIWLKEGKKVRKHNWKEEYYYQLNNLRRLETGDGTKLSIDMSEFTDDDWEIYEEPHQTLYDKRSLTHACYRYKGEDLKEVIKDFLFTCEMRGLDSKYISLIELFKFAKEKFGKELLE